MIVLPDGTKFIMQWKQIIYIKGNDYATFEVVPMFTGKDIVVVPNLLNWESKQKIFSQEERSEIIFLMERIAWKRDIRIVELDVAPNINRELEIHPGMLEATLGYKKLSAENLFDVDCRLNKDQVKEIYCKLEIKFAEAARGRVQIPKELLLKGSVLNEVCVPALKNNNNAEIVLI